MLALFFAWITSRVTELKDMFSGFEVPFNKKSWEKVIEIKIWIKQWKSVILNIWLDIAPRIDKKKKTKIQKQPKSQNQLRLLAVANL